jgi:hypothetical protein
MKVTVRGLIESFLIVHLGMIAGFLVSCATWNKPFIDDEFKPYQKEFIELTNYNESDFNFYSIKFFSLEKPTVGMCYNLTRTIHIDSSSWYVISKKKKRALMLHEFGHCVCDLEHHNKLKSDGCPESLMHENLPQNYCLTMHWDEYIVDYMERCK